MKKPKRILSLSLAIVFTVILAMSGMTVASAEETISPSRIVTFDNGTISGAVYLPAGYDESVYKYPATYFMPFDGYSNQRYIDDGIQARLDELMDGNIMSHVVVMPNFKTTDNFKTLTLNSIIPYVEANYKVYAAINSRAVLGVNYGGYMSVILGLTQPSSNAIIASLTPTSFIAFASVMGNFLSPNPWYNATTYGEVATLTSSTTITVANINKTYGYISGASEDPSTYPANQIGTVATNTRTRLGTNLTWWDHYGVKILPGKHGTEFYMRELESAFTMISRGLASSYTTAITSTHPTAVEDTVPTFNVNYSVTLSNTMRNMLTDTNGVIPVTVGFNVRTFKDMANLEGTYKVIHNVNKDEGNAATGARTLTGSFSIPTSALASAPNFTGEFYVEIFGWQIPVAKNLISVRSFDEVTNPMIDLMGDWYFRWFGTAANTPAFSALMNGTVNWKNTGGTAPWYVVQPALDWFDQTPGGFGNAPNSGAGYGHFVREFYVPENFPSTALTIHLGQFDEQNAVWINDTFIGRNMPSGTNDKPTGSSSNPWDQVISYTVPATALKRGEVNTIYVMLYNASGGGGWYNGPVGIYTRAALNKDQGKPSVPASAENAVLVKAFINNQNELLAAGNLAGFRDTVATDFFNSGTNKTRFMARYNTWFNTYARLEVTDSDIDVFDDNGLLLYQANRVIVGITSGGARTQVFSGEVMDYCAVIGGDMILYGDHFRLFEDDVVLPGTTYTLNHWVYLPEEYFVEGNNKRYPVIFMLPGLNSKAATFVIDGMKDIFDREIASGRMEPVIMVSLTASSWNSTAAWTAAAEITRVTTTIPNYVKDNYRVLTDARFWGIGGSSLGGGGTWSIGYQYPDTFSALLMLYPYTQSTPTGTRITPAYMNRYFQMSITGTSDTYSNILSANVTAFRAMVAAGFTNGGIIVENGGHQSQTYKPWLGYCLSQMSQRHFDKFRIPEAEAAEVLGGDVSYVYSGGNLALTSNMSVGAGITGYLETVPGTTTPRAYNTPFVLKVEQGGKVISEQLFRKAASAAGSWTEITNIAGIDPDAPFTATLMGTLMDKTVVLDSKNIKIYLEPLAAAMAKFKALNQSDWSSGSWADAVSAYDAAALLYADEGAQVGEVRDATQALLDAIDNLAPVLFEYGSQTSSVVLRKGMTYQIKIDSNNQDMLVYISSNANATVNANGLVTAAKTGSAVITVLDVWAQKYMTITINITS